MAVAGGREWDSYRAPQSTEHGTLAGLLKLLTRQRSKGSLAGTDCDFVSYLFCSTVRACPFCSASTAPKPVPEGREPFDWRDEDYVVVEDTVVRHIGLDAANVVHMAEGRKTEGTRFHPP